MGQTRVAIKKRSLLRKTKKSSLSTGKVAKLKLNTPLHFPKLSSSTAYSLRQTESALLALCLIPRMYIYEYV